MKLVKKNIYQETRKIRDLKNNINSQQCNGSALAGAPLMLNSVDSTRFVTPPPLPLLTSPPPQVLKSKAYTISINVFI
jgi:hypothetical protein